MTAPADGSVLGFWIVVAFSAYVTAITAIAWWKEPYQVGAYIVSAVIVLLCMYGCLMSVKP